MHLIVFPSLQSWNQSIPFSFQSLQGPNIILAKDASSSKSVPIRFRKIGTFLCLSRPRFPFNLFEIVQAVWDSDNTEHPELIKVYLKPFHIPPILKPSVRNIWVKNKAWFIIIVYCNRYKDDDNDGTTNLTLSYLILSYLIFPYLSPLFNLLMYVELHDAQFEPWNRI